MNLWILACLALMEVQTLMRAVKSVSFADVVQLIVKTVAHADAQVHSEHGKGVSTSAYVKRAILIQH